MMHLACVKAAHEGDDAVFDMRIFASTEVHLCIADRSPLSYLF